MFLNEFDLTDDKVTADTFCGVYSYLASRPPTPGPGAAPKTSAPRQSAGSRPGPRASAGAPSADSLSAATGATFPPDYLVDPTGCVPVESIADDSEATRKRAAELASATWRPYDGAGQCEKFPSLGGVGAPFSLLVKTKREGLEDLPPPRVVVHRLHCAAAPDGEDAPRAYFAKHPNPVSGVLVGFAELVRHELGLGGVNNKGTASTNGMSSYLDLQLLYGASEAECAAIRDGEDGRLTFASYPRGARGKNLDSAAAVALLGAFWGNHAKIAKKVLEEYGPQEDETIFQIARHVNIATFRSVFLKDFLPYLASGQHLPEPIPTPPLAPSESPGSNVSIELYLVLRAMAAMEPREGMEPAANWRQYDSLLDASKQRCGLAARCNVPPRLAPSEIAVVRRARDAGVCTLNEFREKIGLPPWKTFDEMTASEPALVAALEELYGTPDNCELYTGLLCEYNVANTGAMLPHTTHACALPLSVAAADKWFQKERLEDEKTLTKWGVEHARDMTLAKLITEENTPGVDIFDLVGDSAFEVDALEVRA